MYTIKKENIYNDEEDCKQTQTQTHTSHKNIDISHILKDVELCIKSGLEDKLRLFFYKFETYEQMHNEVLNLTIVKNLVNNNAVLNHVINDMKYTNNHQNDDTFHDSSAESEIIVLIRENDYLREELNKYKKKNSYFRIRTN